MASEAATRRVGVLAQQLAPEIGLQRNTTSGQSTSYASIGGQPSSYARVHGDVSREPAVWRDIVVVGKEQLKEVLYAKAEGIAKEMSLCFADARDDPATGVIILTGAGTQAFCSGGDQSVRGRGGYVGEDAVPRLNVLDLQIQIRRLPKPVVAMVAGYAVGGGHILHMVCDLTIAADNAVFGQTGPKVGSFDAGYGSTHMARLVGQKKAREMWFLARLYNAKQALDMGLVNTVVPLAELETETLVWCREMLRNSPTALRVLKSALNAAEDGQAGIQELGGNATMLFYQTEEGNEGRQAYMDKRPPDFSKYSPSLCNSNERASCFVTVLVTDGEGLHEVIDLFAAIDTDDLELLQEAVDMEEDTHITNEAGLTPLLHAVIHDKEAAVDLLLQAGADVHATSRSGDTALHWAAYKGMFSVAQLLISNAANIDASGDLGNRPLHVAAAAGHAKIVGLLLTKGANTAYTMVVTLVTPAENSYGNTPLKVAKDKACASLIQRVQACPLLAMAEELSSHSRLNYVTVVINSHGFGAVWLNLVPAGALLQDGGEPERARLAEELRQAQEQARRAQEEKEQLELARQQEAEELVLAARRKRDEEDAEEDRLEALELARLQAEEEERRHAEEMRLKAEAEAKIKAEEEEKARRIAARKAARLAAKKKKG
ncbi:hypothetical protein QJQ45_006844 [Haematococcus lacustris]|nr:hypothetical protein QJQ45_006844 [Haematococcus lacustris]